jgi:predicted phosphoribosyltransferase
VLKFEDRKYAALKLCERLKEEGISGDLIVGILRGGGYMAKIVGKCLGMAKPKGLILAIPVCSEFAYNLVKEFFDKIICLEVVKSIFFAVGMFYEDFRQISDKELIEFLTHH